MNRMPLNATRKSTSGALRDLARLKDSITIQKAATTITQAIQILEQHPQIGRPVTVMEPGYQELVIDLGHYGYVVLYRLESDTVIVIAICHQLEAGYHFDKC